MNLFFHCFKKLKLINKTLQKPTKQTTQPTSQPKNPIKKNPTKSDQLKERHVLGIFFRNQKCELPKHDLHSLVSLNIQTVQTKCMQKHQAQGNLLLSYIKVRGKGQDSGSGLCVQVTMLLLYTWRQDFLLTWHLGAAAPHAPASPSPVGTLQHRAPSIGLGNL